MCPVLEATQTAKVSEAQWEELGPWPSLAHSGDKMGIYNT